MGSLEHFHLQFGHLDYDTIDRKAQDPASGIKLTDKISSICVTCAQEKQNKGVQFKKDSGLNAQWIEWWSNMKRLERTYDAKGSAW